MEDLFVALDLLAILAFLLSWIIPDFFMKLFKNKLSKGKTRLVLGLSIIIFFIAFGISSDSAKNSAQNNKPQKEESAQLQDNETSNKITEQAPQNTEQIKQPLDSIAEKTTALSDMPAKAESTENKEIPEKIYKARILSEGEKISKAGSYIMLAGSYCDNKDYRTCEETLYKASNQFISVKYTFEGQKNPPEKYKEFNENMISVFSDIVDAIDNDIALSISPDSSGVNQTKFNAGIAKLSSLISKANSEMDKVGF